MKNRRAYLWISILVLFNISISCNNVPSEKLEQTAENPLIGSWEISSIYWITKDTTYSIENAQPGLLMINANRYSIMWTPTEEPRKPFIELSSPTDDELKSGFRSIVFNAGIYESTDSTLTTEAQIAKVPGFEGGKQFYRYKLENDKLELTMYDETYPDGKKPEWFGRYVTKFILKKVN